MAPTQDLPDGDNHPTQALIHIDRLTHDIYNAWTLYAILGPEGPMVPITEIKGRLEAYVAGEGRAIIWSIHDAGQPGPDGVHPLLNGDFLNVYDTKGAQTWSGIVDLDFEICQRPDPADRTKMAQTVLGHQVHGVQKYVTPEAWMRMFLDERKAHLRRFRMPLSGHVRD